MDGGYRELAAGAWLVEDKYDGVRIQAHVTPERVSLFSRTLNDVAASYPEVVAALRALPGSFVLDGEIVARARRPACSRSARSKRACSATT